MAGKTLPVSFGDDHREAPGRGLKPAVAAVKLKNVSFFSSTPSSSIIRRRGKIATRITASLLRGTGDPTRQLRRVLLGRTSRKDLVEVLA